MQTNSLRDRSFLKGGGGPVFHLEVSIFFSGPPLKFNSLFLGPPSTLVQNFWTPPLACFCHYFEEYDFGHDKQYPLIHGQTASSLDRTKKQQLPGPEEKKAVLTEDWWLDRPVAARCPS
jgi:hypothetical protein